MEKTMMLPVFDYTVPEVHHGDLWQLGEHLLLCGNCTQEEDVLTLASYLIAGHLVRAIVTDPPYGEIQATWDKVSFAWIGYLQHLIEPEATLVSFCSLPFGFDLRNTLARANWEFRFDLVWGKKNAGFKKSPKQPVKAHEYLFAFAQKGIPARELTFNGYEAGDILPTWGDRHVEKKTYNQVYGRGLHLERQGRTDGKRWIRSLLPGRKKQELPEAQRTIHPSQKPLELVEKLVLLLSNPGETVYDPFLGSGTTLLACEKQGRCCIAIEQSPIYCGLAIERWMKLSGKEPQLLSQTPEIGLYKRTGA